MKSRTARSTFVYWLLPALLWLLTWLLGGFHYETNDDLLMSFIARGIAFGEPVADYAIYFHGFGRAFVWLYKQFPVVPWYGLLLYFLLFISTQLAFGFIYKLLKKRWPFKAICAGLILFFLAGWYEHLFWFNYMRVPFLLAGLAFLNAMPLAGKTQEPGLPSLLWLTLLFFLALCIRPGAALLGVLIVLPLVMLQGLKIRKMLVVSAKQFLPFLIAGIAFAAFLQIKTNDQAAVYRKLDTLK